MRARRLLRHRHRLPGPHEHVQARPAGVLRPHEPPTPTPTTTAAPTATPKPTPTVSTPPTTPTTPGVGTAEENEVLRLVNVERAKGGCRPLQHDAQLRKAAYDHSADMATQNYFSHTSKDGRDFMARIRAAGFTGGSGWAENIAGGPRPPPP